MPESQEYYEVIYNNNYGGFQFPYEFIEAVFRAHPPDSEIGRKLFKPHPNFGIERYIRQGEEADPSWNKYYIIIDERNFYHGYKRLVTKQAYKNKHGQIEISKKVNMYYDSLFTKDNVNYYFFNRYQTEWRDSPRVIELGKKFELFGKAKEEDEEDEENAENNNENSESDEDDDDDDDYGSILLDDDNELDIVTQACKGKTDLVLKKIPIGYDYRVDENDGWEEVFIVFPYKKVIQELLEARQTHSDDKLGPIAKKLVEGVLDISTI